MGNVVPSFLAARGKAAVPSYGAAVSGQGAPRQAPVRRRNHGVAVCPRHRAADLTGGALIKTMSPQVQHHCPTHLHGAQ